MSHERNRGSRKKLTPGAQRHFLGDTNFDQIGRALCPIRSVPRNELYESWEVAKRVRRHLRGHRVVDLACGHGLLAHMLGILYPGIDEVLGVDRTLPPSAPRIAKALTLIWPSLAQRVTLEEGQIEHVALRPGDIVACAHGCGSLTDLVLEGAIEVGADVAVLPCCQDHDTSDGGGLGGWLDPALAIDVVRAGRLPGAGLQGAYADDSRGDHTQESSVVGMPTET